MKKYLQIGGIVISVLFLYLAFRKVDVYETLKVIASVKWLYLVFAVALCIVSLFIRSIRWRIILNKDFPLMYFFDSTCVGLFINNVLPFRMGDFAQAYFLGYKANLSKSMTFSTVMLERLTDLMPPIVILITGSFLALIPGQIGQTRIFIVVAIVFFVIFCVLKFQGKIIALLEKRFPGGRLHKFVEHFYSGLEFLKDRKRLVKVTILTLALWSAYTGITYLSLLSFGLNIGYLNAFFVQGIVSISVTIPSSPGYVGTWEFFSILALGIFKVPKHLALSFALVNHLINWLPIVLLGFFILLKSGVSFSKLENPEENQ